MSALNVISAAFLAISCLSLGVQVWALAHLLNGRRGLVRTGLLRTSVCRVGCAVLYVVVGLNAWWFQWSVPITTFTVFALIQATWQANALADVRLKRKLTRRSF